MHQTGSFTVHQICNREVTAMCSKTEKCEKGKDPKACSPEQIKECHGEVAGHPCEGGGKPAKK